jgi:hypothetical protein
LELFKEELKRYCVFSNSYAFPTCVYLFRSQDMRKERKLIREGRQQEVVVVKQKPVEEPFAVDEYKDMAMKGSFDSGDPLTTNLYVGNINPKVSRWFVQK